jgi:hypothetical protein
VEVERPVAFRLWLGAEPGLDLAADQQITARRQFREDEGLLDAVGAQVVRLEVAAVVVLEAPVGVPPDRLRVGEPLTSDLDDDRAPGQRPRLGRPTAGWNSMPPSNATL